MSATLTGALPQTVAAYEQLSQLAASKGITIGLADFGGFRTLADTTLILKYRTDDYLDAVRRKAIPPTLSIDRFRPIAPYGKSYHDYGAAFDLEIVARPAGMTEQGAYQLLGSYAPSLGLRWGGSFSNPDPDHFELAVPLVQARQMFADEQAGGSGDVAAPSALDQVTEVVSDPFDYATDDTGTVDIGSGGLPPIALAALVTVAAAIWYALKGRG